MGILIQVILPDIKDKKEYFGQSEVNITGIHGYLVFETSGLFRER